MNVIIDECHPIWAPPRPPARATNHAFAKVMEREVTRIANAEAHVVFGEPVVFANVTDPNVIDAIKGFYSPATMGSMTFGTAFTRNGWGGIGTYTIRLESRADPKALLATLGEVVRECARRLHVWRRWPHDFTRHGDHALVRHTLGHFGVHITGAVSAKIRRGSRRDDDDRVQVAAALVEIQAAVDDEYQRITEALNIGHRWIADACSLECIRAFEPQDAYRLGRVPEIGEEVTLRVGGWDQRVEIVDGIEYATHTMMGAT